MRILCVLVLSTLLGSGTAEAFSVLAHQAVVDQSWDQSIVPALRARFSNVSDEDLKQARAYAYGGSHIPDLGYFPLGNILFTDLLHYVRSGDFVTALLQEAETVDEYAFALGVLSHYVADSIGHPQATNRTVAEVYPKLRKKYGDSVTYAEKPSAHVQTEFRFDVLQVARNRRTPDLFKHTLGFQVSKPVLERAFLKTYGVQLEDVFTNPEVAIATYRWGIRGLIHEVTGIAWQLYRADIDPAVSAEDFIYTMSRADFEKEFGNIYREPGYFARFIGFVVKLIPNVGPFKHIAYKPLPQDAQERFAKAEEQIAQRYQQAVLDERHHKARFPNLTLDTGEPTKPGAYEVTDEAYAELLLKLEKKHFPHVDPALRADILAFYRDGSALRRIDDDDEVAKVRAALQALSTTPAPHGTAG